MEIGSHNLEESCFIIAELSANHGGSLETALKTISAAKEAGADAIKLQTFTPDTITFNSDKDYFKIDQGTLWDGRTLYDLYEEAHTPWAWHQALFDKAKEEGLICFSSPFDNSAVDFLEGFDVPAYKIASFEIQDIPLIKYAASKGKPIIISTGIASLEDIELAVKTCHEAGNQDVALLKCTSAYPAPLEDANLATIPDLVNKFNVTSGLSDHTSGITAPAVAVALGGKIIEKHFILDKNVGGPDVAFSLDPEEFKEMVEAVRNTEKAIGKASYKLTEQVEKNKTFGRSLFVVKDIKKGELFTKENIRSIRPGYGLHPKFYEIILGKTSNKNIEKGGPLKESDIDNFNSL